MNKPELKRCPFCDCDKVDIRYGGSAWRSNVYYPKTRGFITCFGCGFRTATYEYAREAVKKWNRRANDESERVP